MTKQYTLVLAGLCQAKSSITVFPNACITGQSFMQSVQICKAEMLQRRYCLQVLQGVVSG